MKIRPVGAQLFHVGGWTDRHDETKSLFEILRKRLIKWMARPVRFLSLGFINKRISSMVFVKLILNLLTTTIVAPPSNASKWQMGFNLAFKVLIINPGMAE
jgi:hypothetical protein